MIRNTKYAQSYCSEDISNIENYEIAVSSEQKYEIHHKLECELKMSKKQLISNGLYYNRPSNELIFVTRKEHMKLHSDSNTGRFTIENRKKTSEWASYYNKGRVLSDEAKKHMSEAQKGRKHSEETKKKISKAHLGVKLGPMTTKHRESLSKCVASLWQNPEYRKMMSDAHKGHKASDETRKKLSEKNKGHIGYTKGLLWWNNGTERCLSKECPGEGWKRGKKI